MEGLKQWRNKKDRKWTVRRKMGKWGKEEKKENLKKNQEKTENVKKNQEKERQAKKIVTRNEK